MLNAKLGDSNAVKQPNKLSFKNAKIHLYNPTFCYEAKSAGKDKATSKRFATELLE